MSNATLYVPKGWDRVRIDMLLLATVVEGDQKAPFSIATTPRCWGGRYSLHWIAPLYPWYVPYVAEWCLPFMTIAILYVLKGRRDRVRIDKLFLATVVEGDQKAPFSIATTPRCWEGRDSLHWIAPLYPWYVPYVAES